MRRGRDTSMAAAHTWARKNKSVGNQQEFNGSEEVRGEIGGPPHCWAGKYAEVLNWMEEEKEEERV